MGQPFLKVELLHARLSWLWNYSMSKLQAGLVSFHVGRKPGFLSTSPYLKKQGYRERMCFGPNPLKELLYQLLAYCRWRESRDLCWFTQNSINQHNRQVAYLNRPWHTVSYPGTLLLPRNAVCPPCECVNVSKLITLKSHLSLYSLASLLGPSTNPWSEGVSCCLR